ncbi:MAG: hypothetical protein LBR80_05150 [Deltaproteobacteria bacterium]|nr:hypothetical protein [Deltaproteobacteria bacterium]
MSEQIQETDEDFPDRGGSPPLPTEISVASEKEIYRKIWEVEKETIRIATDQKQFVTKNDFVAAISKMTA